MRYCIPFLLTTGMMVILSSSQSVNAGALDHPLIAGGVVWREPVAVWKATDRASSPSLVTDASDATHLFFVDRDERAQVGVLYHTNVDEEPISPVDILVGLNEYRVTADAFGSLHVVYDGPNNSLWYSSAPAAEASNARSWSAPIHITDATPGGDIATDQKGILYVCFPFGGGVKLTTSADNGRSWDAAANVATVTDPHGVALGVRCVVDHPGTIHVVWSEGAPPNYYPSLGVFYSQSTDGGRSWKNPDIVAGQHYMLPTLEMDNAGGVHLLWQGDATVGGRFIRHLLPANGAEWTNSETVLPPGQGGMSGEAPLAVDGDGHVNVVTAASGIQWLRRTPTGWTDPVNLSASLLSLPNVTGSIEQPAFAISSGNVLHAAWEFDFRDIYYTSAIVDATQVNVTPVALSNTLVRPTEEVGAESSASASTSSAISPSLAFGSATDDITNSSGAKVTQLDSERITTDRSWLVFVGPLMAGLIVLWVVNMDKKGRFRTRRRNVN